MKQLIFILIVLFTVSSCSSVQFANRKHRKGVYFSLKKNHHHESAQNQSLKPIHLTKHPIVSTKRNSRASNNTVFSPSLVTLPINYKNSTLIKELSFEQENAIERLNTKLVSSIKSNKKNKNNPSSPVFETLKGIIQVLGVISMILFFYVLYAIASTPIQY